MKKRNSRRILLVVVAMLAAIGLVVVSAVASVFAYRQFSDNRGSKVGSLIEGLQIDEGDQDGEKVENSGVLILHVEPGSPAEEAGLSAGTVVLSVNGRTVNSPQELKDRIAEFEVGDTITLTVQNGEDREDVAVTLGDSGPYLGVNVGENGGLYRFHGRGFDDMDGSVIPGLPDHPLLPADPDAPESMMPFDQFGLDEFDLDDLEGMHGHFFGLFGQSALIISVEEGSPASEVGLQPGDAIVEANGQAIEDSQQLIALIGDLSPGDELALQVQRGEETVSFEVTLTSHAEDGDQAFLGVFLAPTMMPREMEFFQEQQNS